MKKRIIFLTLFFIIALALIDSTSPYIAAVKENSTNKKISGNIATSIVAVNKKPLNDPLYKSQWGAIYTNSEKAWKAVNQKTQIKVAVVDSGVDYNHPDLKNRVLKNLGYNFINNTKNVMDDLGHGTQVAGIIAAEEGNKIGITGIVGPLDVKIIPIKVLDKEGKGPADIVAKGIIYAADCGADIINISIDFDTHDSDIEDALNYAYDRGSFVVVAAGNSSSNCDLYSPAGDAGAYTVSAMNSSFQKSYFSSYGSSVSTAAPGEDILTTTLGGKYEEESGTSMAAPIVSGVAAIIKAENPNLSPEAIAKIINLTATDIMNKGKDKETGYGLVNAYKAVLRAKQ